jgi:Lhr-like helicase
MKTRTSITAFDLIGYEGKQNIRIKSKGDRRGRRTFSTVHARDGYTNGPVTLQALDVDQSTHPASLKQINRSVDPRTPVELLTRPVGDTFRLGGDSWIIEDRKSGTKQWHASGATVEVISVYRPAKRVTVWVSENVCLSDEDVKVGVIGELDTMTAEFILNPDKHSTEQGWDGLPTLMQNV